MRIGSPDTLINSSTIVLVEFLLRRATRPKATEAIPQHRAEGLNTRLTPLAALILPSKLVHGNVFTGTVNF